MLKIRIIRDVASRVAYHKNGLALNTREKVGRWLGSAAAAAGFLAAGIPAADLAAALAGFTATGAYMGQRRSTKRRAGWDVVLSPHKSVSIAALCMPKSIREAVRQAWEDAVTATVLAMESLAATTNGKAGILPTGNLLVAVFTHERSRRDDPHLHTHCLVMNATLTPGGWRSLEPAAFFRHNLLLDAILQRELARNLRAAGFTVILDAKGRVTLPAFPAPLIARFSRAKRALDNADATLAYGTLAAVTNVDARRNLLNDRLRPSKRPPARELSELLEPTVRRSISQKLRTTHAIPSAQPTPSPEVLAASLITPIYRRMSLWPSTKRLFRSLLEAARIESNAPFTDFLRALPFVRPPQPHPLNARSLAASYNLTRLHRFTQRLIATHTRRSVPRPRRAAAALLETAIRQYAASRSLLRAATRQRKRAGLTQLAAFALRARAVWKILQHRERAGSIARHLSRQRQASIAAAARRGRTQPPAPQQALTL